MPVGFLYRCFLILLCLPAGRAQGLLPTTELQDWTAEVVEGLAYEAFRRNGGIYSGDIHVAGIQPSGGSAQIACGSLRCANETTVPRSEPLPLLPGEITPGPGDIPPGTGDIPNDAETPPGSPCGVGLSPVRCDNTCGFDNQRTFSSVTSDESNFQTQETVLNGCVAYEPTPTRVPLSAGTTESVTFRDPVQASCSFPLTPLQPEFSLMFYFQILGNESDTVEFMNIPTVNNVNEVEGTISLFLSSMIAFPPPNLDFPSLTVSDPVIVRDGRLHHFTLTGRFQNPSGIELALFVDGQFGGEISDSESQLRGDDFQLVYQRMQFQDIRRYSYIWTERRIYEKFVTGQQPSVYPYGNCYCSEEAPRSDPNNIPTCYRTVYENIPTLFPRVLPSTTIGLSGVLNISHGGPWNSPLAERYQLTVTLGIEYAIVGMVFAVLDKLPRRMTISTSFDGVNYSPVLYISNDCEGDFNLSTTANRPAPQLFRDSPEPPAPLPDLDLPRDANGQPVFLPVCTSWTNHTQRDATNVESPFLMVTSIWGTSAVLAHLQGAAKRTFRASSLRLNMEDHITYDGRAVENPSRRFFSMTSLQIVGSGFCFERGQCVDEPRTKFDVHVPPRRRCECEEGSSGTNCEVCPGVNTYQVDGACYDCNCNQEYTIGNSMACDSEGQCNCLEGWNRALAGKQCTPYAESIIPTFGPEAGFTDINITGKGLLSASVFDGVQGNFTSRSDKELIYTTYPKSDYFPYEVPTTIQIRGSGRRTLATIPFTFQYRPNPNITRLSGFERTVYTGGLNVTVIGTNMDSVFAPELLIRYFDEDGNQIQFTLGDGMQVDFLTTVCQVLNSTAMSCPTPDFTDLDGFLDTYYEDYFNAVVRQTLSSTTPAVPATIPTVPTPLPVPSRRKRQTTTASGPPSTFVLGFVFDGYVPFKDLSKVPELEDYSQIIVFQPPTVQGFPESDGVKLFDPETDVFLRIPGTMMNFGAEQDEYKVEIGQAYCSVTDLSSSQLVCRPPPETPSVNENDFRRVNGMDVPHVKLILGNFEASLGYLQYPSASLGAGAIAGIVVGIVLLIVIGVCVSCYVYRRWHKSKREGKYKTPPKALGDPYTRGGSQSRYTSDPATPGFNQLSKEIDEAVLMMIKRCTIPEENVKLKTLAGKGNFGTVYKGELKCPKTDRWRIVAVKTLKGAQDLDAGKVEGFLKEAMIMLDFHHENVLSLLGVCMAEDKPMVVLPFMEHGDLRTTLKNKEHNFTVGDLLHFCLQTSRGMEYLAKNKFVHRDLAARNIMVNSDFILKVADFGLSQDIYEKEYYRINDKTKPLPVKWMSPECMSEGVFTEKSDVWAYGVLMWEVFTRGSNPYPTVNNCDVKKHITEGLRLDKPADTDDLIFQVMMKCWAKDPSKRPCFKDLVDELVDLLGGDEEQEDYLREYTKNVPRDYHHNSGESGEELTDSHASYVDSDALLKQPVYLELEDESARYQVA